MGMFLVFVLFPCVLVTTNAADAPPAEETNDASTLKQHFREETLNIREEMYSLFSERQGAAVMALQLMDLVREVKDVLDSVKKLEDKMDTLSTEQKERMSRLEDSVDSLRTELSTKLTNVEEKVDVMRSEVRLISQHKLTWQNSTWDNMYYSDFAVDGIYTLSAGYSTDNPVQHPGRGMNRRNNMVIIDLGAFFKIHTIKLWNRIDVQQEYALGVLIYADDQLIGSIHEIQRLYNVQVNGDVYGRKIYVKQSLDKYINFIEIQVFGSGPYGKAEQ